MEITEADARTLSGAYAEFEAARRQTADAADRRAMAAAARARLDARAAELRAQHAPVVEAVDEDRLARLLTGDAPPAMRDEDLAEKEAKNRRLAAELLQVEADLAAVTQRFSQVDGELQSAREGERLARDRLLLAFQDRMVERFRTEFEAKAFEWWRGLLLAADAADATNAHPNRDGPARTSMFMLVNTIPKLLRRPERMSAEEAPKSHDDPVTFVLRCIEQSMAAQRPAKA